MSIRQRIAKGLLKAAGVDPYISQRIFGEYWDPSMATSPPSDVKDLLDQYGVSGWVYIAAKRIALKASSADAILTTSSGEEIEQHVLIDLLNKPMQGMSGRKLRHLLHLHLELCGEAFWYAPPGGAGGISAFIPLPPNMMEVIPGKDQWVDGYLFDSPTGEKVPFKPEEIVHFTYPNPDPANPMRGTTGLRTLIYQIATNQNAQIWNYQFFVNGARPSGYLATDAEMDPDEADLLRRKWDRHHKGQKNWNKTAVATHGLKYVNLGLKQSEMDFLNQLKHSRDFILNVMGVPKSIAGVVEDVNRANSFQDELNFMTYTVNPILELIADTINAQVLPRLGDTGIVFDFESLMPKDDEFTLKKVDTLTRRNIMLINEARNEYGLKPVPWGDKPWGTTRDGILQVDKPVNLSQPNPFGAPGAKPPEEKPKPGETPSGQNPENYPASPEDNLVGQSYSLPVRPSAVLPRPPAAKTTSVMAEHLAYKARIDSRAHRMKSELRVVWGDVERSIINQVAKSLNGDGVLEVEEVHTGADGTLLVKAATGVEKSIQINWKTIKERLQFLLLHHLKEAAQSELDYVIRHYHLTNDLSEAEIASWAASRAVRFSKEFTDRAEEELAAILAAAAAAAWTLKETLDQILILFDGKKQWESERTSVTEMSIGSSYARIEAFKRSKDVSGLQWSTAGDDRVRPSHQAAESQVVPVGELFVLGSGVATPGPGMSGNPEEDVNCRCCVFPVLTSLTGE